MISLVSRRTSAPGKSPATALATVKVTFAELPADGQNKENDEPAAAVTQSDEPTAAETGEKPMAPPQPQQQHQQMVQCNNAKNAIDDEYQEKIIPWRAQLRKTNSTLNLLE